MRVLHQITLIAIVLSFVPASLSHAQDVIGVTCKAGTDLRQKVFLENETDGSSKKVSKKRGLKLLKRQQKRLRQAINRSEKVETLLGTKSESGLVGTELNSSELRTYNKALDAAQRAQASQEVNTQVSIMRGTSDMNVKEAAQRNQVIQETLTKIAETFRETNIISVKKCKGCLPNNGSIQQILGTPVARSRTCSCVPKELTATLEFKNENFEGNPARCTAAVFLQWSDEDDLVATSWEIFYDFAGARRSETVSPPFNDNLAFNGVPGESLEFNAPEGTHWVAIEIGGIQGGVGAVADCSDLDAGNQQGFTNPSVVIQVCPLGS